MIVAADMEWIPENTSWQVVVDPAEAVVAVSGDVGSFRLDDRGDTTPSEGVPLVVAHTRGAQ